MGRLGLQTNFPGDEKTNGCKNCPFERLDFGLDSASARWGGGGVVLQALPHQASASAQRVEPR